ncbi:MAG: hypothetical protein AB2A00_39980 [Myxococcota bacterium]
MARPILFPLACCAVLACGGGTSSLDLDGGEPTDGGEVVLELDAGAGSRDQDAAPPPPPPECVALVVQVCGEAGDASAACLGTPACELARVTRDLEPTTCAEKMQDHRAYPPCELQTGCLELETKVCGEADGGCQDEVACESAREVAGRLEESLCRQALRDESAFPRCAP